METIHFEFRILLGLYVPYLIQISGRILQTLLLLFLLFAHDMTAHDRI